MLIKSQHSLPCLSSIASLINSQINIKKMQVKKRNTSSSSNIFINLDKSKMSNLVYFSTLNLMKHISDEQKISIWYQPKNQKRIIHLSKCPSQSITLNSFSRSKSFLKANVSAVRKDKPIPLLRVATSKKPMGLKKMAAYGNSTSLDKKIKSVNHFCKEEEKRNVKSYSSLFNNVNEGLFWVRQVNKANKQSNKAKKLFDMCRYDLQRLTRLMILHEKNR